MSSVENPDRRSFVVAYAAVSVVVTMLGAGCSASSSTTSSTPSASTVRPTAAPTQTFAVGNGPISVTCAGTPIAVDIWYPAQSAGNNTVFMAGRWPIILFSHGLQLSPGDYFALLKGWAAAGFVIVAPVYPHTASGVADYVASDYFHQPADAACVLTSVLANPRLRDHLDATHIAAAGHSGGALTAVGEFTDDRDPRLTAGIVLAGGLLEPSSTFTGAAVPILFVHGDKDPRVPFATGMAAYHADPWPKAFLRLRGQNHLDPYMNSAVPSFNVVFTTTLDFLRWTLYGDAAAKTRLARDASGQLTQAWSPSN